MSPIRRRCARDGPTEGLVAASHAPGTRAGRLRSGATLCLRVGIESVANRSRSAIGNTGTPGRGKSEESQSPHDRPSPDEVGPFAQLIAEALSRLGISERKAARLITDAAWELDKRRTTVHASAVSRWMSGTVAQPDMRHWIAFGLKIPHGQVHAAAEGQRKGRTLQPQPDAEHTADVQRRQFLIASGMLAVPALRRALFTMMVRSDFVESDIQLDRLDPLVTNAWRLRQSSRYGELGDMLPKLLGDLNAATAHSVSEQDVRRLVPMTVHAYNAASSLLRRVGADELAAIAADRSLRSAAQTGDALLQASASYRLANVLLSADRLDDASELALTAATSLESHLKVSQAHLAMWGGLLLTAAVATARQHADRRAWDLHGQARTAALWLGHDHVDLNTIFGPSNVAIHSVEVASDLEDYDAAIEHGGRIDVDSLPPELLERRSTLLVNLATAHQRRGDTSDAVALLLKAEQLAPEEIKFDRKARELASFLVRDLPARNSDLRALAGRLGMVG
jgi:tetratricopeptide (TPR) repeat protein